jgi:dUTP pyrophosphatase
MKKKDIEDYVQKLKELEKELNDDSSGEINKLNEIDSLLSNLNDDILRTQKVSPIKVKIKKLNENAVIPTYSKDGDAGMDLTITSIISETTTDVSYGFGVAMEIPIGFVGLIFPRSSVRKYDLSLTNAVGVIDSGYRGELQATFKKTNWLKGDNSEKYKIGDRGAQIIIIPYPQIQFIESDELSNSDRGTGGFGSTGS